MSVWTFSALTDFPNFSVTTSAMACSSRVPSAASATRYSSRVSWIIWPSPRRASDGGFL